MPRLRLSSYNLSQINSDRAHDDTDANTHRPDEHAVNIRHTNSPRSRYPDHGASFSVLDSRRFTSQFPSTANCENLPLSPSETPIQTIIILMLS